MITFWMVSGCLTLRIPQENFGKDRVVAVTAELFVLV